MEQDRGVSPDPRGGFLVAAVVEEHAQLVKLRRALAAQREGVASGSPESVEAASHRVAHAVLTLDEARRRREDLVAHLGVRGNARLDALEAHHGPISGLVDARAALREEAAAVLRDLEVTQEVLQRALRAGDAYLQSLFASVTDAYPATAETQATSVASETGRLLNREA
jgi:hypothetical protein